MPLYIKSLVFIDSLGGNFIILLDKTAGNMTSHHRLNTSNRNQKYEMEWVISNVDTPTCSLVTSIRRRFNVSFMDKRRICMKHRIVNCSECVEIPVSIGSRIALRILANRYQWAHSSNKSLNSVSE
jgi:hypothetical protein